MGIKHLRKIPTWSTGCRDAKYRWGIKISRFSTSNSIAIILQIIGLQGSAIVTMEYNSNSYAIYRMVPFSIDY